jgi:hypothetical protein
MSILWSIFFGCLTIGFIILSAILFARNDPNSGVYLLIIIIGCAFLTLRTCISYRIYLLQQEEALERRHYREQREQREQMDVPLSQRETAYENIFVHLPSGIVAVGTRVCFIQSGRH